MGTFTNIARDIYNFSLSTPSSEGKSYLEASNNVKTLYDDYSLVIYAASSKRAETTCTISNFLLTGLISGHVYYGCYWCRALNNATKTTDLYVGSVDSEADLLVGEVTCTTSGWTRASGIKALPDKGKVGARLDYNNTNTVGIYGIFNGFLVVDLTASGIAGKSKEWCDDHLYWVPSGSTGTFTDYDAEGTKGHSSDSGNPSVSTLMTYHNYAAQKANRGGTTVAAAPDQANASWVNAVYNAQVAMTTKGSTYGSCGVVKVTPANFVSITAPTTGSTGFYSNGRSVVNSLIRNADALYAQQYCIQRANKHIETSCDPDECGDCSDCCYAGDCCEAEGCYDCCDYNCQCDGVGCRTDICPYDSPYCYDCCQKVCDTTCCDNDCCDTYTVPTCPCDTVCTCNSVCACNWV